MQALWLCSGTVSTFNNLATRFIYWIPGSGSVKEHCIDTTHFHCYFVNELQIILKFLEKLTKNVARTSQRTMCSQLSYTDTYFIFVIYKKDKFSAKNSFNETCLHLFPRHKKCWFSTKIGMHP
jgi:hypothetical protein